LNHVGAKATAWCVRSKPRQRRSRRKYSGEIASTYPPLLRKTNVISTESGSVIRLHALNASNALASSSPFWATRERNRLPHGFRPHTPIRNPVYGRRAQMSRKLKRGDGHRVRQTPEVESPRSRRAAGWALGALLPLLGFRPIESVMVRAMSLGACSSMDAAN
jgi:hypothetical protein